MSEISGSLHLRSNAEEPTPTTAHSIDKDSKTSVVANKKRALYSITDKIRILQLIHDYSSRFPTHTIPMQLRALNLTHLGYATTKMWIDTCDEIYAAERLGFGSRYRLSLEERVQVKEELLREKNNVRFLGDVMLLPAVAAMPSLPAAEQSMDIRRKEDDNVQHITPITKIIGRDCDTDVHTPDEEEILGAIIYRSSHTAKTRREANL